MDNAQLYHLFISRFFPAFHGVVDSARGSSPRAWHLSCWLNTALTAPWPSIRNLHFHTSHTQPKTHRSGTAPPPTSSSRIASPRGSLCLSFTCIASPRSVPLPDRWCSARTTSAPRSTRLPPSALVVRVPIATACLPTPTHPYRTSTPMHSTHQSNSRTSHHSLSHAHVICMCMYMFYVSSPAERCLPIGAISSHHLRSLQSSQSRPKPASARIMIEIEIVVFIDIDVSDRLETWTHLSHLLRRALGE